MTNRTQPETPAGGPLGDTGDGDTGVPSDQQGMSNRPGDRAVDANAAADEDEDEVALDDDDFEDDEDEVETPGNSASSK